MPLTLARMPPDTDFAVIEIGMNHPGEIAPLARLARPRYRLDHHRRRRRIWRLSTDLEGIAREKAAIFDGLRAGGTAIFPGDQTVTPILLAKPP